LHYLRIFNSSTIGYWINDIKIPRLTLNLFQQTQLLLPCKPAVRDTHRFKPIFLQSQPTPRSARPKSGDESAQEKSAQKSRKRWKKAEKASKAADEEYAEISKEHDTVKVIVY